MPKSPISSKSPDPAENSQERLSRRKHPGDSGLIGRSTILPIYGAGGKDIYSAGRVVTLSFLPILFCRPCSRLSLWLSAVTGTRRSSEVGASRSYGLI